MSRITCTRRDGQLCECKPSWPRRNCTADASLSMAGNHSVSSNGSVFRFTAASRLVWACVPVKQCQMAMSGKCGVANSRHSPFLACLPCRRRYEASLEFHWLARLTEGQKGALACWLAGVEACSVKARESLVRASDLLLLARVQLNFQRGSERRARPAQNEALSSTLRVLLRGRPCDISEKALKICMYRRAVTCRLCPHAVPDVI